MKKLLLSCFLFSIAALGFAQAPNISYSGPQVYVLGNSITNLAPSNSGGAVPNTAYSQVTTLAGNGIAGFVDATGAAARFKTPYSVASDPAGNIYVSDYGNNCIRKITPAGVVTTFVTGLSVPGGIAFDAAGNLYIADTGNQNIKKVTPAGVMTVYAGSGALGFANGPALAATFRFPQDVAVDVAGNVYVADYGNHQIRKISTTGIVSVFAGSGSGGLQNGPFATARFRNPFGVDVDAAGYVYVSDFNNSTIRKVAPDGTVSTLAGDGTAGFANGNGTSAKFNKPADVAVDAIGNVYVTDSYNSLIRKITPAGDVTTFAGSNGYFGRADGLGTAAVFGFPMGVCLDPGGNLYTSDNSTHSIRKILTKGYYLEGALPPGLSFDPTTGVISGTPALVSPPTDYIITAFNNAGSSSTTVNIEVRLPSDDATLSNLTATVGSLSPAFSADVKKYIINVPNGSTSTTVTPALNNANAVLTLNGSGLASGSASTTIPLSVGNTNVAIKVVAEDGTTTENYVIAIVRAKIPVAVPAISLPALISYSVNVPIPNLTPASSGGPVPANEYAKVTTLATNIPKPVGITTDPAGNVYVADNTNKILKITPSGTVSVFVDITAGFANVTAMASDAAGNIYVADSENNKIRVISPAGVVSEFTGYSGDYAFRNGNDYGAAFKTASGVSLDGLLNVYIADQDNNMIRKRTLDGQVTTLAGTLALGATNGPGASATFRSPVSVASDFIGNVYVADQANNIIRKITPGGVVSTLAGSGAVGNTNANGTAASFSTPAAVAMDGSGILYVADAANSKIRKIAPNGDVTLLAGNGTYALLDGVDRLSSFNYPLGITAEPGHVYVADFANDAVRKIETTGYSISPIGFLPAGLVFDGKTGIISGTPTAVTGRRTFTITAYNESGSSSSTVGITITALSSQMRLASLLLDAGTLSPVFGSGTLSYNVSVSKPTLILTPTTQDAQATIKINGVSAANGVASAPVPLVVGPNVITILVTAPDGVTTRTYTLNVTRTASVANTNLSGLTPSAGSLSPAFAAATTNYTTTVGNATTSFTVTPTSPNSLATIQINGTAVASGAASAGIPLNVGPNTITTIVTDENGNNKTYTITVTRAASAEAGLTALGISDGTLTPVFNTNTLIYSAAVGNTVSSITVTPTTIDVTATIKVNGVTVVDGMPSAPIVLAPGNNNITVVVTAEDGVTVKSYSLSVSRGASANDNLSALTLSSGVLSPVFTQATLFYSISVPNAVSSMQVTPTAVEPGTTITVNGTAVASGSASLPVALASGVNALNVVVTAPDGVTSKTYNVTVTRTQSTNSTLSNLVLSSGTLSPVFAAGTLSYSSLVSNAVTSINVTPTVADAVAFVQVNGITVVSGSASADLPLAIGSNPITAVVTAEDGSVSTYTINVVRSTSADATLSALSLSGGTLSPAFAAGTTTYTATVPNTTTGITLTPTSTSSNSVITVNGVVVATGASSATLPLTTGPNNISVQLTAEDGVTVNTYTITVTRAASAVATLSALSTSAGALNPVFVSATNAYAISVANAVSTATITPTVTDATATITINGVTVVSGVASVPVALNVGANSIPIVVTAADGVTTQTYTLNITRGLSSNSTLSNLIVSAGPLSPVFAPGTFTYSGVVANAVTTTTVTPTVADAGASVTVNGVAVASGSPSAGAPLAIAPNIFTIVVTAQDGSITTYSASVTRAASSDASLSALTISAGTLSPAFAPGTTAYTALVPNATTGITFTPTGANANATITVNGNIVATGTASALLPLTVGANNVTVQLTAEDGVTITTYSFTVTRAASPVSTLASLTTSAGPISPVFNAATLNYTASVANGITTTTITPTLTAATATVKVNGVTVASGTASGPIALNIGANPIVTEVTAQDGSVSNYTLNVTRSASANASLASLTMSAGVLSPVFASGTLTYAASVANATATVTLMPTLSDVNATVTVNGTVVTSGTASAPVILNVGPNAITTVVTAQDGTTQTYTVNVTRAGSPDANLAALTLSAGTLTPAFAAATVNYTVTLPNASSTITITPTQNEANATITVNGTVVTGGTASLPLPMVVGGNVITVAVTSQDGTVKTYTINAVRLPSSNALLANLVPGTGSLSPAFASGTNAYQVSVINTVTSINFTPTLSDAAAAVTVNGASVASGTASANLPLVVGLNNMAVSVTAEDGTVNNYTIGVTRATSIDATLSNLTVSGATLSPSFASATAAYTATVANTVTSVTLTPTVNEPNATVMVNGVPVASGAASGALPLVVGPNVITATVTAQDGGSVKIYQVTVTRSQSSDGSLSSLTISAGTLSPNFAPGVIDYTAHVSNATASVTLTPTNNQVNAVIRVNGNVVAGGSASAAIPLVVGDNFVTVQVTAQDGTLTNYTVNVIKSPPAASTDAGLLSLAVSTGTLSPAFAQATHSYTVSVPNATASIMITAASTESHASITVNGTTVASGTASTPVSLVAGPNIITTIITAEDGVTNNTYTITVTRAPSVNANLANIVLSAGTLTPTFAQGTITYTATVANSVTTIQLTPTLADATATIKVNGVTVVSGSASAALPLVVGPNSITTVVTAQSGATKTYTVTVTRAQSSNANLAALTLSAGTLSPAFAGTITDYAASVGNAVSTIQVTPALADATATVKVNGVTVASGSASTALPLLVGPNIITTIVSAQDGTPKTYTVTVTRAPSSNANLANIIPGTGTLSPAFAAGTINYTIAVGNAVATIKLTPTVADATATIQVNGVAVVSGTASADQPLVVGPNVINTVVTAQDGSTKTYAVVVNRALSPNADLISLSASNGTLSPVFAAGLITYTAAVGNAVTGITITAVTSEANASLQIMGAAVASGSPSANLPLLVGPNAITTQVTAQDGTIKTYTITVTRAPSPDATLNNLALNAGTLTPGFANATTVYTAAVGNAVTTIAVTPTVHEPNATVKVNGVTVASGSASAPLPLVVGPNIITTVVTAQDGTSTQTYTTTVTRAPSSNAFLTTLGVSTGTYSPSFANNIYDYVMLVTNNITTLAVTPVLEDNTATLTVANVTATNGVASAPVTLAVGNNFIRTVVTAQDGVTQKTYTVIVNRALSSENDLSDLSISTGPLTPGFQSGITSYTASVSNITTSLSVKPTLADATATITINNVATPNAALSAPVPLTVGTNNINVVVTAQNGQTNTYTIVVTRIASANADLANLTGSTGALSPAFAPNTLSYTAAAVTNAINTIKLTPTLADATATITVNGITVTSGSPSPDIPLNVGANAIPVVVKAQAGNTKSYVVNITRAASANADLAGVTISGGGVLSPAFAAGTTNYTIIIGNANAGVTVTPSTSDATATVTVNGATVAPGTASNNIPLVVGNNNTITIIVKAQDGTPKIYTIVATREASSNANLSNLAANAGSLSPAFAPATQTYDVTVLNGVTDIRFTPTVADATATVTVNSVTVTSGTASINIPLVVGQTAVPVTVTAQDGTTKQYVVTVTRQKSANADLVTLTSNAGSLLPAFTPGETSYSIEVPNSTLSATVTPTLADANATMQVQGLQLASGTESEAVLLSIGNNAIPVQVKAENGDIKTYIVTIRRMPSGNNNLGGLQISAGSLSPVFSTGELNYRASVPYTIDRIRITPSVSDATATVTVNGAAVTSGSASGFIDLIVGLNPITVVVTAADGSENTYEIVVTRETRPPSTDNTLTSLFLTAGELSPAFSRNTLRYNATVTSDVTKTNVVAIVNDPNATITVNGAAVTSGHSSGDILLVDGENIILVTVVAEDKTSRQYFITVTRANFTTALPNLFTPNGDGYNDLWVLPNINLYPDCTVKVFNRAGQQVFNSVGYGTAWDGTWNGKQLPPGTYYYIIDLKHNQGIRSGAVTIVK